MTGPVRIACIGEAMIELSVRPDAPDMARLGVSGDTLNTAIYLKRALPAAEVAYVTRLGRDPMSARIRDAIAGEGLRGDLIGTSGTRGPGLYAITLDDRGERSFTYWRDRSAARTLFDRPPHVGALDGFDVVYASGITLAILSPAARGTFLDWLYGFRAAGGRFAFDSNYRPRLWPDAATARDATEAAWRQADIALPSLDDERALFGDASAEAVLDRLRGYGAALGALKRGAEGPLPLSGAEAGPFPPARRVVDTTAAGDSFNGGYLAAHLAGRSEAQALAAGHDLARVVVGHRGAIVPAGAMPGPAGAMPDRRAP